LRRELAYRDIIFHAENCGDDVGDRNCLSSHCQVVELRGESIRVGYYLDSGLGWSVYRASVGRNKELGCDRGSKDLREEHVEG